MRVSAAPLRARRFVVRAEGGDGGGKKEEIDSKKEQLIEGAHLAAESFISSSLMGQPRPLAVIECSGKT